MCLLLFAQGVHPDYPLIVAANRDEFHQRETAPADWWGRPPILAGRDLEAGGTWLGVNGDGAFAALTNYREPPQASTAPSRGGLVVEALQLGAGEHALRKLTATGSDYNGFNMIFGGSRGLFSYSNRDGMASALARGLYGLSNHLLETPWPKVMRGKALLAEYLQSGLAPAPEPLFELLADRHQPEESELPATGVSSEWERLLAPMFIVSERYGTRCSTVLTVSAAGEVRFSERSYDAAGGVAGTRAFSFLQAGS